MREFTTNQRKYAFYSKQGYEVGADVYLNSYDDIPYTILYRPCTKDYVIAWDYSPNTGEWSQGHYGFKSITECNEWFEKVRKEQTLTY